jgi:hypothetical protein
MADVPNVAGVPALLTGFAPGAIGAALMVADVVGLVFGSVGPQWGIFSGGSSVIAADSVASLEYKQDWAICDYPVERGAFETYNKVQVPFMSRVRFMAGGAEGNRAALLSSIAAIAGDFNLYDVATPETTYINVNVSHYDYHRTATNGVGLLVVDVWLQEVRVAIQSGASVASVSGAPQVNGGSLQPTKPEAGVAGQSRNIG